MFVHRTLSLWAWCRTSCTRSKHQRLAIDYHTRFTDLCVLQGDGRNGRHNGQAGPDRSLGNGVAGDRRSSDAHAHMSPHEAQLWQAARAGDAATVRTLLRRHPLLANMLRSETGSTLLLKVAAVQTLLNADDFWLAKVMQELVRGGASVLVAPADEAPMHVLAAQPLDCCIRHRVVFLLDEAAVDGRDACWQDLCNAWRLLPEQAALAARLYLRAAGSRTANRHTVVARRREQMSARRHRSVHALGACDAA